MKPSKHIQTSLCLAMLSFLSSYALAGDTLLAGQKLTLNQSLTSTTGGYVVTLQSDGNIVLRDKNQKVLWASGTQNKNATNLNMQSDGNLVLRTNSSAAVWNTATGGSKATKLIMQADGNLVLRTNNATDPAVWATGTGQGVGTTPDTTKPVISLNGSPSVTIPKGSSYVDLGATATDDRDGNITNKVIASGGVNTSVVGTYYINYNVKDAAGNAATTVTRTIAVTSNVNPPPTSTKLPIEVLGPQGVSKTITLNLKDVSRISHLYLRCNACGYEDIADNKSAKIKATVIINNNGIEIPLKHFTEKGTVYGNKNIKVIGGEADYGGIGGAFRTVRFMVPVSGLKEGTNTLTFKYKDAELQSLGFRIIDLNFLQNGDINRKLLSPSEVALDDPTTWKAPTGFESSTAIANGKIAWNKRDSLTDAFFDKYNGSAGSKMHASCADCHSSDGRDLKYFNFSNDSIIERSKFHKLSETDGKNIAAYIRSLPISVVKQARPWNPTYQPGVGLDSKPAYEWAAGAGIDAVLDKDSDIKPYLFPKGTSSINDVRAVVNRFGKLNLRELPINIPMPEWNQWLPAIHPDDAFDTSKPAMQQDARGRDIDPNSNQTYYTYNYLKAKNDPTPENLGWVTHGLKVWFQRDLTCVSNGPGDTDPHRAINGAVMTSIALIKPNPAVTASNCQNYPREDLVGVEWAKRGITAWASVKLWELNHSKSLEEKSKTQGTNVCSYDTASRKNVCVDASEARGWVADGRNVFDRPPHFTAVDPKRRYLTQSEMQGIFESNMWYHLNMILNTGYRSKDNMPSHFAYTYSHVELLHYFSDVPQSYRFWATMIKQRQLQTNGTYGREEGLDLRTAQPYVYYSAGRGHNTQTQGGVGQPLWGYLATAMVEDFVADVNNATETDWRASTGNSKVQDRNAPSSDFKPCSPCKFSVDRETQGTNTYQVIPYLRSIGVEENALNNLITWGKKTWRNGNWDSLRK